MTLFTTLPRLSYLLLPGVIAVGLYLIISNLNPAAPRSDSRPDTISLDFDAWAEGINTMLYDTEGVISYTLEAEWQVHLIDGSSELTSPLIRLHNADGNRWNIMADSGRILARDTAGSTEADRVDLIGNVQAFSVDDFGSRMELTTDFLTFDPETEIAETDREVFLSSRRVQQSAIGMIANLANDEIVFLANVKGSYDPSIQ